MNFYTIHVLLAPKVFSQSAEKVRWSKKENSKSIRSHDRPVRTDELVSSTEIYQGNFEIGGRNHRDSLPASDRLLSGRFDEAFFVPVAN